MELWIQVIFAILICLIILMLIDKAYALGYKKCTEDILKMMDEFIKKYSGKNTDYKDDNTGWTP